MAAAGLIAAPLSMLAVASPAAADTWPFNSNFRPDTGNHGYCYSSVYPPSSAVRAQMYNAMVYMTDSTAANRSYASNCDLSGAGQTDVVWREGGMSDTGNIGEASCTVFWANTSPRRCDRFLLRVNGSLVRSHYSSSANRNRQYRKTACHELGHSLGLNHYPSPYTASCQRSGWTGTVTSSWTRTWTSHHRSHINSWFG